MAARKSQIRKFLLLIRKSQLRKFLQNTAQHCLKTVLKVVFFLGFLLCTNFNKSIKCFVREGKKVCICGLAEDSRSQTTRKDWGPQIASPKSFTFAEGQQI
jgi:hypothetical protein